MLNKLVRANKTGSVSTTKFWYNIACTTATFVVLWYGYKELLGWEIFAAYLISVGGFSSLSKFINYRFSDQVERKDSVEITQGE